MVKSSGSTEERLIASVLIYVVSPASNSPIFFFQVHPIQSVLFMTITSISTDLLGFLLDNLHW